LVPYLGNRECLLWESFEELEELFEKMFHSRLTYREKFGPNLKLYKLKRNKIVEIRRIL